MAAKTRHGGKLNWILVAGSMVLGLAPWWAEAATQVTDVILTPSSTDYAGVPIAVQQFDPSLGTLYSVSINASGNGTFTQMYQNEGPSSGTLTIQQSLELALALQNGGSPVLDLNQSVANAYQFAAFSAGSAAYPVTAAGTVTLTSPATLAQFTGQGMADVYVSATGETELPGGLPGGNLLAGGLLTAGVDLTVTYDYSAIPEASTWMAAGAAILALGLNFRPARRKAVGRQG